MGSNNKPNWAKNNLPENQNQVCEKWAFKKELNKIWNACRAALFFLSISSAPAMAEYGEKNNKDWVHNVTVVSEEANNNSCISFTPQMQQELDGLELKSFVELWPEGRKRKTELTKCLLYSKNYVIEVENQKQDKHNKKQKEQKEEIEKKIKDIKDLV